MKKKVLAALCILLAFLLLFIAFEEKKICNVKNEINDLYALVGETKLENDSLRDDIQDLKEYISFFDEENILKKDAIWIKQNEKISSYMH